MAGDQSSERALLRIGAASAIIGSIALMVANVLHPRSPEIQVYERQIEAVAASGNWVTVHLVWVVASLFLLAGMLAIGRSITTGPGAAWGWFANAGALVSTSIISVLIGLDGLASKAIHVAWANAPAAEKATALQIALAMEEIDVGLFTIYIIVFFGITFMLYGLAVSLGETYPRWMGWIAFILGLASLVVGLIQAYTGLSPTLTNIGFATLASLLLVWLFVMGILLWRKAGAMAS